MVVIYTVQLSIYSMNFSYLIYLFHSTLIVPLLIICRAEDVTILSSQKLFLLCESEYKKYIL